jgi:thiol:disulfide interchange protein
MKKLILFSWLLLAGVLAAQEPSDAWRASLDKFTITHTGSGYKAPDAFLEFLDQAEGAAGGRSERALFFDDPVVFFERWGLIRTLLLILLGGLALNLTPCVLPMIPVNLAIIGAGAQSESRRRGFALGGAYGLGITVVYGLLGLAVVLGGARFGALNSSPWFNFVIAGIFLLLALAMFGVFHIDLSRLHNRLTRRQVKEEFLAAFTMGGVSALLAGACVAPVVIAVLLLSGNLYANGALAGLVLPFVLGLGMALPWPFAGAGLSFLPKPGSWMEWVKRAFGLLILLFAFYYGLLGGRLLAARQRTVSGEPPLVLCDGTSACFRDVLEEAAAAGKPVFIDFWADWCKNCHAMDEKTFSDPAVQQRLKRYRAIQFDATNSREKPIQEILDRFGVMGLPTYFILEPVHAEK